MANYSAANFVIIPPPGAKLDPGIRVYDINGTYQFSIEPWISTFTQKSRYVYIVLQNNVLYQNTLDFCDEAEALQALHKLNEIKKIYATSEQNVDSSKVSLSNDYMPARVTNFYSGLTLACDTAILNKPITGSKIRVLINGVEVRVGNGPTYACYFSPLGGISPRENGSEQVGDYLYWNYVGGLPVVGYDLDTIDRITFNYLTQ